MEPEKIQINQSETESVVQKKKWVTPEIGMYGITQITQSGDTGTLVHDSEYSYS